MDGTELILVIDTGGSRAKMAAVTCDNYQAVSVLADWSVQIGEVRDAEDLIRRGLSAIVPRLGDRSFSRMIAAASGTHDESDPTGTTIVRDGYPNGCLAFGEGAKKASLEIPVVVVNDFEAACYGAMLDLEGKRRKLRQGEGEVPPGEKNGLSVWVGPGAGIGKGRVERTDNGFLMRASEGGNVNVPVDGSELAIPTPEGEIDELELIQRIAKQSPTGLCRLEQVIAGPGLETIYQIVSGEQSRGAEIAQSALSGNEQARAAVKIYTTYFARAVRDMIIDDMPEEGIFLVGRMLTGSPHLVDNDIFREIVSTSPTVGDHASLMKRTSVYLVESPNFMFLAAAQCAIEKAYP